MFRAKVNGLSVAYERTGDGTGIGFVARICRRLTDVKTID